MGYLGRDKLTMDDRIFRERGDRKDAMEERNENDVVKREREQDKRQSG